MPEPQHDSSPTIPPALEQWLHTATYDLAEQARARVRAEVAAHFADAVAEAMAKGKSRAAAESEALAALGNRFDAQILMARSNLTAIEEQFIKGMLNATREPLNQRLLAWGWIPLLLHVFLFFIQGMVWLRLLLLFVFFFAAGPFFMEVRKRAMRGRGCGLRIKTALLREKLVITAFFLWFWLFYFLLSTGSPLMHRTSFQLLIQFLFMGLFWDAYARRIVRKLGGWPALEALAAPARNETPEA